MLISIPETTKDGLLWPTVLILATPKLSDCCLKKEQTPPFLPTKISSQLKSLKMKKSLKSSTVRPKSIIERHELKNSTKFEQMIDGIGFREDEA